MTGALVGILMQAYASMPGVDSVPRHPVTDSLRIAEVAFLYTWRREWMTGRRDNVTYARLASVHCHHDGTWRSGAPNIIRSRESSRSYCPVWFPADDSLGSDESRDGVDASLSEDGRRRMRRLRSSLIARFDTAMASRPGDPWVIGQLVRLAVDQKEPATALRAARGCQAPRPWCLVLEGYATHAAGRDADADSVFSQALAVMKPADRCEWSSIARLLDARSRATYERIDCAARDSVNATFWWLADPLYTEPGNARRAEHFARNVLVRLHAGVTVDERWDWRAKYGGDALATMIVRYGWPSHVYWAGYREDYGHFEWLGFTDSAVNVAPEYALPRFHTTPSWRAVLDPFTLGADDLARFAPRLGHGTLQWEGDYWPVEHWARRAGPLVEVPAQAVLFRRDSAALMAIGLDVPEKFFAPGHRVSYEAVIVGARGPTEGRELSRESLVLDGKGTTVLAGPLSSTAQIVSAELAPSGGAPGLAARARRGVHPPPPLSTIRAGEIAISDPLFFRPGEDQEPPTSARAAMAKMFGSLTFTEKRIGVFWETYGAAPSDSLNITLRVASRDRPGLLRRLGTSIGVVQAAGSGITMQWSEGRTGRREGLSWAGDVPIQARAVVLDASQMSAGRYSVEISVGRAGTPAVTTRREITIVR